MYRLLDPTTCPLHIRVDPNHPAAIVDSEDIAVAAVSRRGGVVYANRVFLDKFKIRSCDLHHLNVQDIFREKSTEAGPARRRGGPGSGERILDLSVSSDGLRVGFLVIGVEPGSRRRRSESLRRIAENPDHTLFSKAYCGLYVADPEAYTLKVNPAYEKIAFLPESEVIGRNLRELEEKGYFSQSVTLRVLAALKAGNAENITLFQKIITGKEVIVTGVPVFSETGRLKHVVTFVRDIINLETLARKCDELNRRREKVWQGARLQEHGTPSKPTGPAPPPFPLMDRLPIIARDPLSLNVVRQAFTAAGYGSPVLLTGETGVGKDLIAKYIHLLSSRERPRPFVAVNCSAIPQELLESELFGYEEGAFSGAKRGGKEGLFEQADGGILFLNEISEMPLHLQAKLLTALDGGLIRRVGGTRGKRVRTRIICATNSDLHRKMEDGSFRSDLYYRIKVLAIHIPPLRERREDILPLIRHFTARICGEYNVRKYFSPAAQETLVDYHWPGNVRELKNLIEHLVVFSSTAQISLGDLPEEVMAEKVPPPIPEDPQGPLPDTDLKSAVRRYEQDLIRKALEKCGSYAAAAKWLGVDPTTLSRKLRRRT